MRAFSVCNIDHPNKQTLQHSARLFGYDLEFIGIDYRLPWFNSAKLVIFRDMLFSRRFRSRDKLKGGQVIVFVDAFDTIFTGDSGRLLKEFEALQTDIVYGSSRYCYPGRFAKRYPDTGEPRRFLNGGIAVGRVGAWRRLFRHYGQAINATTRSEQAILHSIFTDPRCPVKIKLDSDSRIAYNLNRDQLRPMMFAISPDSECDVRFEETNTCPCIVQQPGIHRVHRFLQYYRLIGYLFPELDVQEIRMHHLAWLKKRRPSKLLSVFYVTLLAWKTLASWWWTVPPLLMVVCMAVIAACSDYLCTVHGSR